MAAKKGSLVLISNGTAAYDFQMSSDFSFDIDMIETTNKDSDGYKSYIIGDSGGTMELEAIYDQSATEGFSQAFADAKAGTSVTARWGEVASSTKYYTASAFISSISSSAPENDKITFRLSLQLTGEITEATNA